MLFSIYTARIQSSICSHKWPPVYFLETSWQALGTTNRCNTFSNSPSPHNVTDSTIARGFNLGFIIATLKFGNWNNIFQFLILIFLVEDFQFFSSKTSIRRKRSIVSIWRNFIHSSAQAYNIKGIVWLTWYPFWILGLSTGIKIAVVESKFI